MYVLTSHLLYDSEHLLGIVQAGFPGFRAAMEAYQAAVNRLAYRLLRLLALALNLPAEGLHGGFEKPIASLRPLHYGPEVSDPAKVAWAANANERKTVVRQ